MSSTAQTYVRPDPGTSVMVVLGSPVCAAVMAVVARLVALDETIATSCIGVATAVPSVALLLRHRLRTTSTQRVAAIAERGLALNPFLVVALLTAMLVLVDSVLGAVVGAVAGAAAGGAADYGASTHQVQTLASRGFAVGSLIAAVPAMLLAALFGGRKASHYLHGHKVWVMTAAAVGDVLVRMLIVVFLGSYISAAGFAASLLTYLISYSLVGVLVCGAMLTGAWWGSKGHEAYVGSRLLAELDSDDRAAALELLAGAVRRPVSVLPDGPSN